MTTALTVSEQVEQALAYTDTKAKLIALAADSARIVEITNPGGYKECDAARISLKMARVLILKTGKQAREDAIKFQKEVIAKEKELVELIEPEETRLGALQDAVDRQKEIEKQAKDAAERERVAAVAARFDAIKRLPLDAVGKSSDQIATMIVEAKATDTAFVTGHKDDDGNASALAYELRLTIGALSAARDRQWLVEQDAAKIAAERAELERLRAEHEAMRAESERLAALERERQASESQRIEAAARAEREALEREKAAQAKAARDAEIAAASLVSAAVEALALLELLGEGDNFITQKLAAALRRESIGQAA